MAKLSLDANPTFSAKVAIPIAGGASVDVAFTFTHRTRDELEKWLNGTGERTDLKSMMDMLCGWELDDEFNETNVARLVQNYIASPKAIVEKYVSELAETRSKN